TEQQLALVLLLMLPSAHYKDVGVRISSFRSWIPTPPILCLRFVGSLAVATQDSRPSRSLVLSRETLSFSASCRFIPAHCNRDFSLTPTLTTSQIDLASCRPKLKDSMQKDGETFATGRCLAGYSSPVSA